MRPTRAASSTSVGPPAPCPPAPYRASPTAVAWIGLCTTSESPESPVGTPRRTGMSNTCSASSGTPCMIELPPVTTTPPAGTSLSPPRTRSRATSVKISSTRGWMISDRIWRESCRALRPPPLRPAPPPSPRPSAVSAQPWRFFSSSASAVGVRRPTAMSLEMWSPPSGRLPGGRPAPSPERAGGRGAAAPLRPGGAPPPRGAPRLQHGVLHLQAGAVDAADHVAHRRGGAGDEMHLDLEAHARHAERLLDSVLAAAPEGPGETWEDLAIRRL